MPAYLIIGIDPGHTVGVAAIDFSGKLIHAAHVEGDRPEAGARTGMAGAISLIESWGTPSLIATDVRPAPEMALKLASSFNVPLFVPERPWREDDKKEALHQMVDKAARSGIVPSGSRSSFLAENAHERDAIAAALAAWRHEQNLLRKADNENLPPEQKMRLQHLLLQGYRHDFALQKINDERAPAPTEPAPPTGGEHHPGPLHAKTSFSPASAPASPLLLSSERANAELRKRVSFLEHEREGLLHRMRLLENGVAERMLRERTLRAMQAQITRLQLSLRQTYARLSGQKGKKSQEKEKPRHPIGKVHSASIHHSASKPAPRPVAPHSETSPSATHPPPLKTLDESSLLDKLVSEYRRGRRS